jgi:hypothetical protein
MNTTQLYSCFLAADQAITSSTGLTTITGFSAAMEANRAYGFDALVQFNLAGIVSGFKFGVSVPASPTNSMYNIEVLSSGLAIVGLGLSATVGAALAVTGLHIARFHGVIENGANAGNLAVQFAQNTSDGSAITAKRGSWIRTWQLS